MTNVIEHNGRVRYELTAPWFIGGGLQPTVKVGETGTIELWVHEWPDNEGRVRYGYNVREDGRTVASGTDLRSGVGSAPDLDDMLSSLISFAQSYAESMTYEDSHGVGSDPLNTEDRALGEWADAHENDLYEFSDMGEEE